MKKAFNLLYLLFVLSVTTLYGKMKIMPLGNSITWDWHYNDSRSDTQRHGYRNYLWYKLQEAGYDVDFVGTQHNGSAVKPHFDGDNEGHTGYTTYQIANLIYDKLKKVSPDVILLHIGTNDSLYYAPDNMEGLSKILDKIDLYEERYDKHIIVILAQIIPLPQADDWMSIYNRNLKKMAEKRISKGDDIVVVNMNVIDSLIDGIHPTNSGYKEMASIWFKSLDTIIKEKNTKNLIPIIATSILF